MDYWAQPRIDREQMPMFAPTLGDMVTDDHTVRMFDEILGEKHICLATFRRTGALVHTPVWFAEFDGKLCLHPDRPCCQAKPMTRGRDQGIRSATRHLTISRIAGGGSSTQPPSARP